MREALEKSFYLGGGRARVVRVERDNGTSHSVDAIDFDRRFNCSRCGTAFPEPTPALFSSNSPIGACPECEGFGRTVELDLEKVIPNPNLSIRQGLIAPWRTPAYREMNEWMIKLARKRKIRTAVSFREMTDEERTWLLDGEPRGPTGRAKVRTSDKWPGVRGFFRWLEGTTLQDSRAHPAREISPLRHLPGVRAAPSSSPMRSTCASTANRSPTSGRLSVRDLSAWIDSHRAQPDGRGSRAAVVLRELKNRVGYLTEVGLGYLTLERQARTLSGGEAQRIHLASALGSLLSGTLYALDEPTVGLHAADARRLLAVLRHLRDLGNTVVVVEHDPTMIAGADFVVELGPGGGSEGGGLMHAGRAVEERDSTARRHRRDACC